MTKATKRCPLCRSDLPSEVAAIPAADICELYRRMYALDVTGEIKGATSIAIRQCGSCSLISYMPAFLGSQDFYASLQSTPGYYEEVKPEHTTAAEWIPDGSCVLEVGCGEGAFARHIPTCRYTGVEYSDSAAKAARSRGLNVTTEPLSLFAAKHGGTFDVVCLFQVLEHVLDPREFLDSCLSCIRGSGFLVIAVPAFDSFQSQIVNHILDMPPHHTTRWPDSTLEHLCRLFPLKLRELRHEVLIDSHTKLYTKTMVAKAAYSLIRKPLPVTDLSASGRAIDLIARIASRLPPVRHMAAGKQRPTGARVACLYQTLSGTKEKAKHD
jgi:SAM-dependent methyltransferase